ncbi:MAG: mucoidy inhibitor MuiA family protein [Flavobacteriales bacterium]|nr:mucoidy inhibitor MuiA family protein [Flavobacteriales bacterium]
MKLIRPFAAVAIIVLSSLNVLAQETKTVSSKITDVTVFLQGAQITQVANVSLKAGQNELVFNNLTASLDPNSVAVDGNPGFTILSVQHRINYLATQQTTPEIEAVMDSLDEAQMKLKEQLALRSVYSEEKQLLVSNRSIKGDDAVLLPEDLADMADFYRSRLKELEYKMLEIFEKEKELNEEIQRLQNALNNLNARKGQNPSEIVVMLDVVKAATVPVAVSYTTYNAGWFPVYDLRSEEINSPIDLIYKAKIYQSTGADWDNVNLVVSTGNPSAGGQAPALTPWYLYIYDPKPITYDRKEKYGEADKERPAVPQAGVVMEDSYQWNVTDDMTMANYTQVEASGVTVEFKIGIPFDVPSDNQQYDVELQRSSVKANYEYIVIPKLDNDAFLRAQLTDWAQYNLLPGESNIYFKGTYVGKGYIDPAMANDTLDLSLGRDKSLIVKREMLKDFSKTASFGGKNQVTKAYEISVTNNKKVAVPVTIEDQIPISQNADIEVEYEELSGGQLDAANGTVTWKQTLQAGETLKKQIRFNVKFPKKKLVSGI